MMSLYEWYLLLSLIILRVLVKIYDYYICRIKFSSVGICIKDVY